MRRSRRWIIAIAVVAALSAAALWYTRPLTLTELLGTEARPGPRGHQPL